MRSQPAEARSHYEQWRELVVAGNVLDDRELAIAESYLLGNVAFAEQDYPEAQRQWTRHLSLLDSSDINSISTVTRNLGYVLLCLGNDTEAATWLRESLIDNQAMGMKQAVAACVAAFGALALARGDLARAARLFGASEAITRATHTPLMISDAKQVARNTSLLRERLDEATFNAAWAAGRAMTLEQAVDMALALVPAQT